MRAKVFEVCVTIDGTCDGHMWVGVGRGVCGVCVGGCVGCVWGVWGVGAVGGGGGS